MQTSDRSGIVCDHCGTSHKSDFTYYSFDFHHIAVTDGRTLPLQMLYNTPIISSLDICTSCFNHISQIVVEQYKKCMNVRGAALRICELSGTKLGDNYYYCVVTKVDVKTTGQPNICTQCKKQTHDPTKACSCGNKSFVRPALTHTDKRFLEFYVSEDSFVSLRKKTEDIRKTVGSWTTQS